MGLQGGMRPSTTLLGVSGSLRRGSYNTALLHAAAELAPADVSVDVATLHELSMYDADVERRLGFPGPVVDLRERLRSADGLLIATPEYNYSVTGVLKNAIDWLSRGQDSPLDRVPAGVMASAGGSGGSNALRHLRHILSHNRVRVLVDEVRVRRGGDHFVAGRLETESLRREVGDLVAALTEATHQPAPPTPDGAILVVGSDAAAAWRLADLVAESGIRTLTATTLRDGVRLAGSRRLAGLVLDPALGVAEAEIVAKEIEATVPGLTVVRPGSEAAVRRALVLALGRDS
jgi:chromate reductase